jgi:phosphohistidine phosphatase SixA
MLLIRHASAGDRHAWVGDDELRPLDEAGLARAQRLPSLLASYRVTRLLTSRAVRCTETLEPLARALQLDLELHDELRQAWQSTAGLALVRSLAGADVAICGHGGLEEALATRPKWKKGGVLVVDADLAVVDVL